MGALCSGKSDNPSSIEARPTVKSGGTPSVPKNSYQLEKSHAGNPTATGDLPPTSGLVIDDKSAKNIQVEKHLGTSASSHDHGKAPSSVPGIDEAKLKEEAQAKRQQELESDKKEEEDRVRREKEETDRKKKEAEAEVER